MADRGRPQTGRASAVVAVATLTEKLGRAPLASEVLDHLEGDGDAKRSACKQRVYQAKRDGFLRQVVRYGPLEVTQAGQAFLGVE